MPRPTIAQTFQANSQRHSVPDPQGLPHQPARHLGSIVPSLSETPTPTPVPAPRKPEIEESSPLKFTVNLTEAQRQRLAEIPEKRRQRVETLLATGDRICQGEAFRLLAPPAPARPSPASVEELLSRLREDPAYPSQAAEALAQAFDDRRSWGAYHASCQRAWAGHVPCSSLVQAWREATSGRARNPGALFMSVLKREAPDWCSGSKRL